MSFNLTCWAVSQNNCHDLHRQMVHSLPCYCGNHIWQRWVNPFYCTSETGQSSSPRRPCLHWSWRMHTRISGAGFLCALCCHEIKSSTVIFHWGHEHVLPDIGRNHRIALKTHHIPTLTVSYSISTHTGCHLTVKHNIYLELWYVTLMLIRFLVCHSKWYVVELTGRLNWRSKLNME